MVTALLPVIFLWPLIAHLFALDDPLRDASSGISGRDEFWSTSLAAITDYPFGLGFKRASIFESGHNGYLKTLVEFGVVGGGLIIFLFGCIIAAAARRHHACRWLAG